MKKNKDKEKEELTRIANEIRKLVIGVANRSKSPHVGSSLSCVDLLVCLYFHELNINKKQYDQRDIFILSKAHAAMALYAILHYKGLLTKKTLLGYFQNNGTLPGHLDKFTNKWINVSAGSLGHGFNMAIGMAYGHKLRGDNRKFFTIIGDGESEEGSIWEGALFAPKFGLNNFTAILDYNNMQGYGRPAELCSYEPIVDKWKAFGWETYRVNGHNFKDIIEVFKLSTNGKPKMIIADTIKGKGVSFMENAQEWHYYIVTDDHKKKAFAELNSGE